MDEQAMLQRIAGRLGRSKPLGVAPSWQTPSVQVPNLPAAGDWGQLAARFVAEVEALGGKGHRVAGMAAAREQLLTLLQGVTSVVAWNDPFLKEAGAHDLPGIETLVWDELAGEPALRQFSARAGAGITTADLAVAETGSVVLSQGPGRGRMAALLPPLHIVVVPASKLVPSVPHGFRWLAAQARQGAFPGARTLPSFAGFNTGPSRSADIEGITMLGVHGPGRFEVILVE